MLPREKLDLIASVQTPQSGVGMDTSGWSGEDKRLISTRSAYDFLFQGSELGDTVIWKRIWKLEVPQRIRVFIWLTFQERLLTNVERVQRHIVVLDLCEICRGGREDIEHVLRSCSAAKGVWIRALPLEVRESFFSLPFHDWLRTNLFDASFIPNDGECRVRLVVECCRVAIDSKGSRVLASSSLAKQGRGLSLDSTLFPMVPVDIACFVEKEQRDSSPVTTSPSIIEQAVPFDLGGSD
ncbi:hypothetical protein V6N13_117897 [Hibiscus sabdariffa]